METQLDHDMRVAVYDSHKKAVNAVKKLKEHGYPLKQVSLIAKAEMVEDNLHISDNDSASNAPAYIGAGAGLVAGLLTGLGVFAIPGFGFLYGAGAIIGTIGGLDLGIITGGAVTLLTTAGMKEDKVLKHEDHLKNGKYIVMVHGKIDEIKKAEEILHTEGTHLELD